MGTCAYWVTQGWESVKTSGSCNSSCDDCVRCNNDYTPYCNSAQKLCSNASQTAADLNVGAAGAPTASRDVIIKKLFPQSLMNELIQWILDAANMGAESTSPIPTIAEEDRDFVYADKINEIIDGMVRIYYSNNTAKVERDQIITTETFNRIMEKINNLQINSSTACDMCVWTCNAGCQSCNSCVGCQCDCDND